jgi:hypothetical protein
LQQSCTLKVPSSDGVGLSQLGSFVEIVNPVPPPPRRSAGGAMVGQDGDRS